MHWIYLCALVPLAALAVVILGLAEVIKAEVAGTLVGFLNIGVGICLSNFGSHPLAASFCIYVVGTVIALLIYWGRKKKKRNPK